MAPDNKFDDGTEIPFGLTREEWEEMGGKTVSPKAKRLPAPKKAPKKVVDIEDVFDDGFDDNFGQFYGSQNGLPLQGGAGGGQWSSPGPWKQGMGGSTVVGHSASYDGGSEKVRLAVKLQWPVGPAVEIWTGSRTSNWRGTQGVEWVLAPDQIHQSQAPQAVGIKSFDMLNSTPLIFGLDMPDMQAPKITKEWWLAFVADLAEHRPAKVFLMCGAGRGRTGTMLAVIYGLITKTGQECKTAVDLVNKIRELGCDKWVETKSQLEYIAAITGKEVGDAGAIFKTSTTSFGALDGDKPDVYVSSGLQAFRLYSHDKGMHRRIADVCDAAHEIFNDMFASLVATKTALTRNMLDTFGNMSKLPMTATTFMHYLLITDPKMFASFFPDNVQAKIETLASQILTVPAREEVLRLTIEPKEQDQQSK